MDLELTAWQMLYLCMAPSVVYAGPAVLFGQGPGTLTLTRLLCSADTATQRTTNVSAAAGRVFVLC
jgi:hypothetical protein